MKGYWCFILLAFATSCQPRVLSFTAQPSRISPGDSVHLSWETRGKASMNFHQKKIYVPPDSVETLEFILTATRGKKISAPNIRQVVVGEHHDMLALTLSGIDGDSLVYTAEKDVAFQSYLVASLSVQSGGAVMALHSGHNCVLTSPASSACMQGLPYSGFWQIKIKMTAAQVADHHQIPGAYSLLATITPK